MKREVARFDFKAFGQAIKAAFLPAGSGLKRSLRGVAYAFALGKRQSVHFVKRVCSTH